MFNNYRELLHKILHISYPFNLSHKWKVLLHNVQNWQNCAAFNHGNLTFWRYQKLSHTNNSVQDKHKHRKCEHFLSYCKYSKCLPLAFTYSLDFFLKLWIDLYCGKFSRVFFPVRPLVQKLYLASDAAFKKLRASLLRYDICREVKFGELGGHCIFWIICRQFLCRHCWATRVVCAEPHASRWICLSSGSSRLQSSINFGSRN